MPDHHDLLWEKIAGKLHGELSLEEEIEFNQMMLESTHLQDFEKAKKIYSTLVETGPVSADGKNYSWKKVAYRITPGRLSWIKASFKYAAIVLLSFTTGYLFQPTKVETGIHYSEIFVPYGEMSQITLSDGTRVLLNSGTTLRFPDKFGENNRTVSVDGEAYFNVTKIPDKPFTVQSDDLNVKVLGTSFNYSAYKEDATASVTLVEGIVEVQDTTGRTISTLLPGHMLTKNNKTNSISTKEVKTEFYSSWSEGKICFDDEPFDQIAKKIERWFNVVIYFENEQLKTRRFTGTILKNKPVDQIMQAFELLSPIRFKHQINANGKDKITIYKRS